MGKIKVIKQFKTVLLYGAILFIAFLMLFPFWFMFIGGFRTTAQINSVDFHFLPEYGFTYLENFKKLFFDSDYPRALFNTIFVSSVKTVLGLFFCSLAGFAFQKLKFPGRKGLFYFVLATMMIPGQVTIIPMYVMMTKFHWLNTYWALIVPGMVSAFGMFIMKQYMTSVPDELIEYSRIDGCTDFRIYRSIVVPIIQPGFVVLGTIMFMGSWNDFLWPLITLTEPSMFTLTIILNSFKGAYNFVDYGTILGGCFISALPLFIIFIIFREKLLTGLVAGSIKS